MRMVLALVTTADREAKLKPRMRTFLKEIREGLAQMLKAGGLEGTPDQVAFMHSITVGQGILQLARDNEEARQESQRILRNGSRVSTPEKLTGFASAYQRCMPQFCRRGTVWTRTFSSLEPGRPA